MEAASMYITDTYREQISKILPFWDAFSPEQKTKLKRDFIIKHYFRGDYIRFNTKKKDGLLLLLEGRMRLYLSAENGREISILFIHKGEAFTIMTVDEAGPNDIVPQLQAYEDSVIAYISRAQISPLAFQVPQLAEFIFDTAARCAQSILNCMEKYMFCSLRHSIASVIIEQAGRERCDNIHITHEQIANHLGTTREVVSREVERLRCEGLISTSRGKIGILDRERLSLLGIVR